MKIAIAGYNTCCLNHTGGVQVRVKKIYQLLSKRDDVDIEYFHPMETDFESVDILHLFKLEPEYYNLVIKAKSKGIKVVLSSIVSLERGWLIDLYRVFLNKLPILSVYKMNKEILNHVDAIITETDQEKQFIVSHYKVADNMCYIIPNGIEIEDYTGDEIYDLIGGEKEYVLQVGRIDSNKNQLNVIKAINKTNLEYVIIGGPDNAEMQYFEMCTKEAKENPRIHFLGWIDSKSSVLRSAYSKAKVVVLPSFHETFGLVALEAAMAKCNIAMTSTLPIHCFHVFDDCSLFNPKDVADIQRQVENAYKADYNDTIRQKVIECFSWDSVIDDHVSLYKALLDNEN